MHFHAIRIALLSGLTRCLAKGEFRDWDLTLSPRCCWFTHAFLCWPGSPRWQLIAESARFGSWVRASCFRALPTVDGASTP